MSLDHNITSKNNKKWNTDANRTKEQFECDQCFSLAFKMLMHNRNEQ
jgi:hypothetical protein